MVIVDRVAFQCGQKSRGKYFFMTKIQQIHETAVVAARDFKKGESQLLQALLDVDKERVYGRMAYSSFHTYCVEALFLSDTQAYTYVGITRKMREVPELKVMIDKGEIHTTNARRVVPHLTPSNKDVWLKKAKDLPQRALDKEIKAHFPDKFPQERTHLAISPDLESKLERVKDLLSQKMGKACTLEEAISSMADLFLRKEDPLQRKLVALPSVRTQVAKRDAAQCTFITPTGKRCSSRRWLHAHHKTPRAFGGADTLENLTTLCFTHHKYLHDKEGARSPFVAQALSKLAGPVSP